MANLRLYRDIYCISPTGVYTLINPVSLSANSYNASFSALTENLNVVQESTGRYFVDLNPILYSFSDVFFVEWYVVYDSNSPIKKLYTRFKLNPYNIGGSGLEIELANNDYIELEIM